MKKLMIIFSVLYGSISVCAQPQTEYKLTIFYDYPGEPMMKYYSDGKQVLITQIIRNKKNHTTHLALEFFPSYDNPQNSVRHMRHQYTTSGDYDYYKKLEKITYQALKKMLDKKPQEEMSLQEIAGLVGRTFNFNKTDLPKESNSCCTIQ